MNQEIQWDIEYQWLNVNKFQDLHGAWIVANCKNLLYKDKFYEVRLKFTYSPSAWNWSIPVPYPIEEQWVYITDSLTLITPFVDDYYKKSISNIVIAEFHKKFNKNEIFYGLTQAGLQTIESEIEKHTKQVEDLLDLKESLLKL